MLQLSATSIMDLAAHRVRRDGRDVHLGPDRIPPAAPSDAASGPGVQPRAAARRGLGPDVYVEPRTVDVHIRRLRKAINAEARPT